MGEVEQAVEPSEPGVPIWGWLRNKLAALGGAMRRGALRIVRPKPRLLHYFESVLATELDAVNTRRASWKRPKIEELPAGKNEKQAAAPASRLAQMRDSSIARAATANPREPDAARMAPLPIPCTAVGLALSGGGIRSAATCLGAIQAIYDVERLRAVDYLSTVSGGGYIGCCLSAATSQSKTFPFAGEAGAAGDVADTPAIAHLRNFSNYLLPRGRSALENIGGVLALICRGLIANLVIVLAFLLGAALLTFWAYRHPDRLDSGSFLPALVDRILPAKFQIGLLLGTSPFSATLWLLGLFAVLVVIWALLRSFDRVSFISNEEFDRVTSDTRGWMLDAARWLIVLIALMAFLDLQPLAISWLHGLQQGGAGRGWSMTSFVTWATPLATFAGAVAALGGRLGKFLETSRRARGWTTLVLRLLTQAIVLVAALILPALIWLSYLLLSARLIYDGSAPWLTNLVPTFWTNRFPHGTPLELAYLLTMVIFTLIAMALSANGYSLHRFYRDRLSKAFLFDPAKFEGKEPKPLDPLHLSGLQYGHGPYPIINAALNVQGSAEANKRGRNAEFFTFTPHFAGSNLTFYTPTSAAAGELSIEAVDRHVDLGTAMAISGAAVSANMGSSTIRSMSPTLALLNVRLGYWLANPRYIGIRGFGHRLKLLLGRFAPKLYLFDEMLNRLDETKSEIYLTDGGHIENLGLYELLKRGCQLIIVVDAEADPNMSSASLLKVERFARIDLGVRIVVPWEEIARSALKANDDIEGRACPRRHGPHAALGRIIYANGAEGLLLYFKSSITGDEKDYILDYKLRNPSFPHETTGDQFFSEEQFEMYRALGYHMVQGFFHDDDFCFLTEGPSGFHSAEDARNAVEALLPKASWTNLPPTP